jgi:hypothetical protein
MRQILVCLLVKLKVQDTILELYISYEESVVILHLKLSIVFDFRVASLARFVENRCNIYILKINLLKKLDSKIFPIILIM